MQVQVAGIIIDAWLNIETPFDLWICSHYYGVDSEAMGLMRVSQTVNTTGNRDAE
jgi:hypothetical protein